MNANNQYPVKLNTKDFSVDGDTLDDCLTNENSVNNNYGKDCKVRIENYLLKFISYALGCATTNSAGQILSILISVRLLYTILSL